MAKTKTGGYHGATGLRERVDADLGVVDEVLTALMHA